MQVGPRYWKLLAWNEVWSQRELGWYTGYTFQSVWSVVVDMAGQNSWMCDAGGLWVREQVGRILGEAQILFAMKTWVGRVEWDMGHNQDCGRVCEWDKSKSSPGLFLEKDMENMVWKKGCMWNNRNLCVVAGRAGCGEFLKVGCGTGSYGYPRLRLLMCNLGQIGWAGEKVRRRVRRWVRKGQTQTLDKNVSDISGQRDWMQCRRALWVHGGGF